MSSGTVVKSGPLATAGLYFIILICLVMLGILCGGAQLAVLGVALVLIGLVALVIALLLFNPKTRREHGFFSVVGAVARGFMLLVPFTVLAVVTYIWLNWDAGQSFTSAGLMAAGAATGAEMAKLGGGRIMGSLLPMLWSMLLSLAWMLLGGLLAALIR